MKVIQEDREQSLHVQDEKFPRKDCTTAAIESRIQDDFLRCGGARAVSRVCEGLLLCGAAALGEERLRALRVSLVVSAAPELPEPPLPPGVALLRVPLRDSAAADLARHLDPVADAICQERERGGVVLVHCVAGVSRSPALCLAFLVKHRRVPLRQAFALLRARRPCVRPSAAFFAQLIAFERRALGAASVAMLALAAPHQPLCLPDVYEPEYRATLWLLRHHPRSLAPAPAPAPAPAATPPNATVASL